MVRQGVRLVRHDHDLGVGYEVVVRYLFRAPTPWAFDLSYMMYGTMFMMAGAYTLSRDGHVRGDFVYRLWRPRTQASVELVLYFLFFFPGVIALVFSGWRYASRSWRYLEVSNMSPANIPIYQFKTVIIAAGILLVVQGVAQVFRCIITIRTGAWPKPRRGRRGTRGPPAEGGHRGAGPDPPCRAGATPMTDPQIALLMLGLFIFVIMLGFPIAFTLMAMGIGFGYYAYYDPSRMKHVFDNRIFDLFVNQTYSVMANDVLTAIPLFLFMGYIVERANIVDRLFDTLSVATRRVPGSLAVAALITCALFATATGIVGAVVTLMGLLALPAMLRANYDERFASGVICAGGTLGILIPPSIMLIVYAAASGVSIVRLYAGALLPGFLLAGMYLVYIVVRALLNPNLAPQRPRDDVDIPVARLMWMLVTSFFPLAVLILSVLGAILFGLATPSEAAAIGALGGLVLAAAYRALTWKRLQESVYLTVKTTAMVCWLFVGSWTFASVFSYLGGEQVVREFVVGLDMTPLQFLLLAQLIIFLLGWPLEWSEIIIIFVPIFLPLLPLFNIDPLFFGILIALNLQTSFLTPPMAMSAYYLKGIAPPHVRLTQIFAGSLPYVFMVFITMLVLYVFPDIVNWLPRLFYGR